MRIFICFLYFLAGLNAVLQAQTYPFQQPELPLTDRVNDLLARLTLEEKAGQLLYGAPAVERLGIPSYNWWNECLHGVGRAGRATVFPQAIGMAATFDTSLMQRVGEAIATEARAKYNVFSKNDRRGRYQGLTFWTPNINIFRDPRWGRGQETYGEDPYLTARMGSSLVRGLQGNHPTYLKAAALAKHFAVHSGPEGLRHEFNARVSMKDLWETYLPAFETLVTEAKVEGVMGAYNRTNGVPCCAHPYLMQEVLRKRWGFDGYFVSDCWALVDFYEGHGVASGPEEAAAMALETGCNLNCGSVYENIMAAIAEGKVTEEQIDANLKQLLATRFRLGLFDPPGKVPFDTLGAEYIRHPDHVALSREAAGKSIVLLKNEANLLPLSKNLESVYVVGPTAAHMQALLANYYGLSEDMKTILEGIVGKVSPATRVSYSQGALLDEPNRNPIDWYSGEASEHEVTIACVGISQLIEGEEGESIASRHKGDRADLRLPQNQIDFIKKMRTTARKLVVVVTGGSALAIPEVYELADAVLFVWYPGEQGGNAVADVIFGDRVPSGRLPVTFPKSVEDLPPYTDYSMKNRTYRYQENEPLFPFGFGLSYTSFTYSDPAVSSPRLKKNDTLVISAVVTNAGSLAAEEVVQLYLRHNDVSWPVPHYALKGFDRVYLAPGEQKTISFRLPPQALYIVDPQGQSVWHKGPLTYFIAGAEPGKRSLDLGATPYVSDTIDLR